MFEHGAWEKTRAFLTSLKPPPLRVRSIQTGCKQCGAGTPHGIKPIGGWLFGNRIDGCQAEYVRVPDAMANLAPDARFGSRSRRQHRPRDRKPFRDSINWNDGRSTFQLGACGCAKTDWALGENSDCGCECCLISLPRILWVSGTHQDLLIAQPIRDPGHDMAKEAFYELIQEAASTDAAPISR